MKRKAKSWEGVREALLQRIRSRRWRPGDLVPAEEKLAAEFGCARTTVNRAMRALAEAGLVERRRRAGTRVVPTPVRRATVAIPIIRHEIESRGGTYGFSLIERASRRPPADIAARMKLPAGEKLLWLLTVHTCGPRPFALEARWLSTAAADGIMDADLDHISVNEWLVRNVALTRGDISFTAEEATAKEAELLGIKAGSALFVVERATWRRSEAITLVRLAYAPGYRVTTVI